MTEAIHPPLDHLSLRREERFESFFFFLEREKSRPPRMSGIRVSRIPVAAALNAKRAAEAALLRNWVPPSKENDHPAVPVVMMIVVLPPELLEVVVMMMAVHAMGRRRADGAGERAGGDEDSDEARSESALEHDDLPDLLIEATHSPPSISRRSAGKGSKGEDFFGEARGSEW
ncbi:hypothetical protein NKI77_11500 [Mesorhizobium opportunistum]|uniref:Uncharacterized protein n=1 Tax=Mesorhizobium opportunistum TaxID=593909 RepID=A0ABV1Y9I0_9HYPH|nr:hypothetical protein [Mesorhizobium sp.]